MNDVVLFAGTTEGRQLAEVCRDLALTLHVCVATKYGEAILKDAEHLQVHTGRMTSEEMATFILSVQGALVVDATHPYATEVTREIVEACRRTNTEYVRVLRQENHALTEDCVFVEDAATAAAFLNETQGNVLLTVGSKQLHCYARVEDRRRLYARILPQQEAIEAARREGFEGKHLIAMQGPFSREMNEATLKMVEARWLVTKDTGDAGGFAEKLQAAKQVGARVVVLCRPGKETGCGVKECVDLLCSRFALQSKKNITIAGIGLGTQATMTAEVEETCRRADLLVGSSRCLETLQFLDKPMRSAVAPQEIGKILRESDALRPVVVMSGDVGFYSGAKKLLGELGENRPTLLPGISSVAYFCSRLGVSWEDATLISLHGRPCNYIAKVKHSPKVVALTGGTVGPRDFARGLLEYGLSHVRMAIGENLSYSAEHITWGTPEELARGDYAPLAVVLAENPKPCRTVCHGWPDNVFLRTDVPMTKQEIRAAVLAKLELTEDAVCWDIGAGTGSVSLEMADCAEDGTIYAVERSPEACELIGQNQRKLGIANVQVIQGCAPEALAELPAPTHVFVGGSGGRLEEVLEAALGKNAHVRLVINTVTAESFARAVAWLGQARVRDVEITQVSVARGRPVGGSHLMTAQNPVSILSCTGGAENEES